MKVHAQGYTLTPDEAKLVVEFTCTFSSRQMQARLSGDRGKALFALLGEMFNAVYAEEEMA